MDKRSYLRWFAAAAVFPLLAAVWLLLGLVKEQMEAEKTWLVTGEVRDREISSRELKTMQDFPGLEQLWTVIREETVLALDGFQVSADLSGVDLESYPLTVIRSGGEKYRGKKPLLAVGKDIFSNLQDESGKPCGERQRELFWQTLGELEPEIALAGGGTEEEGLAEPEKEQREGTRGEFLASVEGEGIYMDQEQMKT